jgi:MoaA/NifB/PqqE/SkfB family radical SAM enzyme
MRFNELWRYRRILNSRRFAASVWGSRRNVLAANLGAPPVFGPYMAELDVTYRCNCRCKMCQRWQDSRTEGLSLAEYQRLAGVFRGLGVYQVSIAGGEPLLREDIFAIIEGFANQGMSVNLCTNGTLLEKYADPLRQSGVSCVTVSLDGAVADSHEKIRGIRGDYQKIENGVRYLAAHPFQSRPMVRVRMTVSNLNVEELHGYFDKWAPVVDHVLIQPVHHCRDAFYTGNDREIFQLDTEKLIHQMDGHALAREIYVRPLLKSLQEKGAFPQNHCYAGVLMVRIDPWGNVYPCLEQHVCVGSVRDTDFKTIWNSNSFDQARRRIFEEGSCSCWYNNTAIISHFAKLLYFTSARGLADSIGRLRGKIENPLPSTSSGSPSLTLIQENEELRCPL